MVRKAVLEDVAAIHAIIESFARKGVMLPRSTEDITKALRSFFVYEVDGLIAGIAALNLGWKDLGEIRSLAVMDEYLMRGIGSRLVAACLEEAKELGIKKVFALTYKGAFFKKMNFRVVDKEVLPQKIWGDCVKCSKFPSCDETAVLIELD